MKNLENSSLNDLNNNLIDLKFLFSILSQQKLTIFSISLLFLILTSIYSFSLANIYESRALLSPVGTQSNISGAAKSYSSLANLAGINLPSQTQGGNSVKALKKLNSLSFFDKHIYPNIFLPDLMAVKSWNALDNKILYDETIYNSETQAWVRDFGPLETLIPEVNESYIIFKEMFRVFQDDQGFVTILVKHKSPYIAKEWIELIVQEINYFYRIKDKVEAQAAVEYLNIQMAQTSFTEIKEVIAQIVQTKTQQLALIKVNDFYVFEYIDPPAVILESNEPARTLICILGALTGLLIGILIALIRYFSFTKK
jgi:LPS O-antigen subunit length determinant protein (WzzB/FepE family)